jgi:hypothetical protein
VRSNSISLVWPHSLTICSWYGITPLKAPSTDPTMHYYDLYHGKEIHPTAAAELHMDVEAKGCIALSHTRALSLSYALSLSRSLSLSLSHSTYAIHVHIFTPNPNLNPNPHSHSHPHPHPHPHSHPHPHPLLHPHPHPHLALYEYNLPSHRRYGAVLMTKATPTTDAGLAAMLTKMAAMTVTACCSC